MESISFFSQKISSNSSSSLFKDELFIGFPQTDGGDNNPGDLVGIHVGGWPPVFEVALLLYAYVARDSNGRSAVGDGVAESVPTGSLASTGQTTLVVQTA